MTTEAYPLYWPKGRPRTERRQRETARFKTGFSRARDDVIDQIGLLIGRWQLGGAHVVVSTNLTLRRDGLPLSGQRAPDDPGVAVYFTYKKRQMCFACDRWKKIEDNMQAVAKTIEALRGVARWGTGDMMEAAFQGFTALPAPDADHTSWREVLGLGVTGPVTADDINLRWKYLRSLHHPDKGGNPHLFAKVKAAYEQGCIEITERTTD